LWTLTIVWQIRAKARRPPTHLAPFGYFSNASGKALSAAKQVDTIATLAIPHSYSWRPRNATVLINTIAEERQHWFTTVNNSLDISYAESDWGSIKRLVV
jgi:hypothetical protein